MIVSQLLSMVSSGSLCSPGQTHPILASVKDGVVLSDEDITQDPQAASSIAKATMAAIVRLWGVFKEEFQSDSRHSKMKTY